MLRSVEDKVLVDLVGDDEQVVLDGQSGDGFELGSREDLAAWVRRRVEDDAARSRGNGGSKSVDVERPTGLGELNRGCVHAQGAQRAQVIAVKGLEEDHFVARIEERHAGGLESSSRAGSDQDFRVRIGGDAVVASEPGGDGLAQRRDAVKTRVDVQALGDGFDGTRGHWRRNFGIAHTLSEVDAANAVALNGHGANLRLDQARRNFAEAQLFGDSTHASRLSQPKGSR